MTRVASAVQVAEQVMALAAVDGIAGHEGGVRELLRQAWGGQGALDNAGNLIRKFTGAPAGPTVAVIGHLDEPGFFVNYVHDNGLVSFIKVGRALKEQTLPAQRVRIQTAKGPVLGVIGTFKLAHFLVGHDDQQVSVPPSTELVIDPGFTSRAEAEAAGIEIGCPVTFYGGQARLADHAIIGKAVGARSAAAVLALLGQALAAEPPAATVYLAAAAGKEAGHLGAKVLANTLAADLYIVVDALSTDPGENHSNVHTGRGPVIRVLEEFHEYTQGFLVHPQVAAGLAAAAAAAGVRVQTQLYEGGIVTAASEISTRATGLPVAVVGVPVRNPASPGEVVRVEDVQGATALLHEFIRNLDAAAVSGMRNWE